MHILHDDTDDSAGLGVLNRMHGVLCRCACANLATHRIVPFSGKHHGNQSWTRLAKAWQCQGFWLYSDGNHRQITISWDRPSLLEHVQAYLAGDSIPSFGGNDSAQGRVLLTSPKLPVTSAEELEEGLQQCLLDPSICKPFASCAKPPPKAHPATPLGTLAPLPQVHADPPPPHPPARALRGTMGALCIPPPGAYESSQGPLSHLANVCSPSSGAF